ncbi:hypothetical protein D0809_13535 [Flavobacterium circumlabens]|uniref:Uncharacterized protein n=1 Tax=Flavobacterium circumlabens TaxID=2133765 RepID=A0A4Y7UDI4_9FLAO|nr:hypothetical protein [Flavobacterium circumlabens]TCN57601.1 hypothetical protein EV142_104261 [Flavobacterium circumlabens]TEB43909.1 hypothetical protein D0809_13535 [Flavobacterium circumlabens]
MKETKKELITNFEKEMWNYLKRELSDYPEIKVIKNKIFITHKDSEAFSTLSFQYLTNSNAYEIIHFVEHPVLQTEIHNIAPPYPSNLSNANFVYSMSTVSEKDGCIILPVTEKGIEYTCELILSRIKNIYLPIIFNLFNINLKLIDNVLNKPKYYSYPFLLILIAMKNNNMKPEEIIITKILSEETLGYTNNKQLKKVFNQQQLAKYI